MIGVPAFLMLVGSMLPRQAEAGGNSVEPCAFLGSAMETCEIPVGTVFIGEGAFAGSSLREIVVPEGVVAIGDYAFSGCGSLSSVTLPSTLKFIDKGAFRNCVSLQELEIPASVESIGDEAFYGSGLKRFVPAEGSRLSSLGAMALADCRSLESVVLPFVLTSIGSGAFFGCCNLSVAVLPGAMKELPELMFAGGNSLAELALPSGVRTIGDCSMDGCVSLRRIDAVDVSLMPVAGEDVWHGVDAGSVNLYVSEQAEADYRNDAQWSRFNIISGTTYVEESVSRGDSPLAIGLDGDAVYVACDETIKILKIYTIEGKMLLSQVVGRSETSIPAAGLKGCGVLLFSALTESGRLVTIKESLY